MDQRNNQPELRNKLFMLLKERAFRRGKIVLASGRESDFYFDMKPAMLDPDGAALLAELILQELEGVAGRLRRRARDGRGAADRAGRHEEPRVSAGTFRASSCARR